VLADRQAPRERRQYTPADQAKALAVVLREEFGVAFRFHGADGEPVSGDEEGAPAGGPGPERVAALAAGGRAEVTALPDGTFRLALPLAHAGRPVLVAVGELPGIAAAGGAERERARLEKWARAVAERLRLTDHLFAGGGRDGAPPAAPAPQAGTAWEALLTLGHLLRRTRIHKDAAAAGRRVLEGALALLPARALAWVPSQRDLGPVVLGEALLTPAEWRQLAAALSEAAGAAGPEPVLCDDVPATAWGGRFPGLVTLLALPVADQEPAGWVVAVNKKRSEIRDQRSVISDQRSENRAGAPLISDLCSLISPFRKSDATLLTPFAALLELHGRASRRYQDLKELLVGLTRSLTAALDAKDSYTFGHSERVARVAVELGRELGLPAHDLSDIYLAGLLHDVGKIGIRDSVLTKEGPLTREEFEHIKQHVTIGYNILAELHPIRNLLPGVLWHHERWDGQGYPHGLAGEAIPLLARILAVADAFDAMSAARPYREAMPPRRVEDILSGGAGAQWDARVVEALLRCRQKVHAIRQRGVGESLCAAIDGALRSTAPSHLGSENVPRKVADD
jgi:HD-GYP domain-containing protein (c-di-GMP phosphodiesterase class II)